MRDGRLEDIGVGFDEGKAIVEEDRDERLCLEVCCIYREGKNGGRNRYRKGVVKHGLVYV